MTALELLKADGMPDEELFALIREVCSEAVS